jgi:hypothetical protein
MVPERTYPPLAAAAGIVFLAAEAFGVGAPFLVSFFLGAIVCLINK